MSSLAKRAAYMREYRRKNLARVREQEKDWRKTKPSRQPEARRQKVIAVEQSRIAAMPAWVMEAASVLTELHRKTHPKKHGPAIRPAWVVEARSKLRAMLSKKTNVQRALAWQRANPERMRVKKQSRARLVAAGGSFTAEELKGRFDEQCGLCAYCLAKLDHGYHADHVTPIARGGSNTIENIVCACGPCNHRKSAKPFLRFMREVA